MLKEPSETVATKTHEPGKVLEMGVTSKVEVLHWMKYPEGKVLARPSTVKEIDVWSPSGSTAKGTLTEYGFEAETLMTEGSE